MLIKITIGSVDVYFGEPGAAVKPEPFYPYLFSLDPIQDTTGDTTGSTSFTLLLLAQRLLGLMLRLPVQVLNDDLSVAFEGLISRIAYSEQIAVTVDA